MGTGTPRSGGAGLRALRHGLFRRAGLLLRQVRGHREERSDLGVQLLGAAQIMICHLDGRKLARTDGGSQVGHRKLMNLRHVTKW